MKKWSTSFLKIVVFLIGIAVLSLCVFWFPKIAIEEVNVNPGDYSLYPLLVCAYGFCITFSIALYQVFKLLTYIEKNTVFSELSLKSLKIIKKCGFIIILFFALGIVTLKVISNISGDDSAGPISLSLIGILVTSIIIAVIDVLQKPLKINQ